MPPEHIAKAKDFQSVDEENVDGKVDNLNPKRWDEFLHRPHLDYSEMFEADDGQKPGRIIWEIENFLPRKIDQMMHGKSLEMCIRERFSSNIKKHKLHRR